jgi:ABC-type dipeptide/oligopeptide/nickel transport system ATPase component
MTVLAVRDLAVRLPAREGGAAHALVDGVGFELAAGEVYGIAGESGCGKTQLLLALMGLSPRGARVSGSALLEGRELVGLRQSQLEDLRGNRIAMVFQDPMSALNPYLTIGVQLTEVLRRHRRATRAAARDAAVAMLDAVHIADPGRRLAQYPHEFSGGMRQRVVIAMALLCEPAVLLADEPTTALDVTVQAQVLALLAELTERLGTAIVFVTHDMGVLASLADRIAVMERGRIVEEAPAPALFAAPTHESTRRLLAAAREMALADDLPGDSPGEPA